MLAGVPDDSNDENGLPKHFESHKIQVCLLLRRNCELIYS